MSATARTSPASPTHRARGSAICLEAATLQPRLHHHKWSAKVRLSDDGFCDSPARIALSHTLTMGLSSNGRTLSYRGLAELGLSTRQAWDLAADNLVVAARTPQGTRFHIRDAARIPQITTQVTSRLPENSALQVRTPGAPVTAWLAHPRTFTILNNHLEDLLGPELIYLAPTVDLLLALPTHDRARTVLERWSAQTPGEQIATAALRYSAGFPTPAPTTVRTPLAKQAAPEAA